VVGGGYAQYCPAHESHCLPVPAGLTLTAAAAIPETFFTVWYNMFERGRLKAGETLLVHGGSSGIGTAAIQLAKAAGARVITTAGSPEKCEACRKLGLTSRLTIKTKTSWREQARPAATAPMLSSTWWGATTSAQLSGNRRGAWCGRLPESYKATVDFRIMLKRLTAGSTLRARSVADRGAIFRRRAHAAAARGRPRQAGHLNLPTGAGVGSPPAGSGLHIGKIVLNIGRSYRWCRLIRLRALERVQAAKSTQCSLAVTGLAGWR
jgi:NADPH2:quinone reductase